MKPTLKTRTSQRLVSSQTSSERFLEVCIETPEVESAVRAPLNLAIVIDRSGSMRGEKLARAKQAADHVLGRLNEDDCVSIVIYDDEVAVIAPSRKATAQQVARCRGALSEVHSRGTTALFDGWLQGCNEIADHITKGSVTRTLLLTDGLANVGLKDSPSICQHVRELFERGISTSTFGIGADFDEDLLSDMADAGHGQFYYIEHSGLIPDAFRREFGDLASVVGSKARLSLDLGPGIQADLLGGIPCEKGNQSVVVPVGDLYAGENRPYYFRLEVQPGQHSESVSVAARLDLETAGQTIELAGGSSFVYATDTEVASEQVDERLMTKVADVHIAEARMEAMKLNRAGLYKNAMSVMSERVERYRAHRATDALMEDMEFGSMLESELDPIERKWQMAQALNASRIRSRRNRK